MSDITRRKREAEEASRMVTVVRDSNDAITIQDFEGRITAWNHGAELMFGYSEQEALQLNILQLASANKAAEQKEFNRRLFAGEKITSFETQRLTKDGRILDVWLTITKLVDGAGKVIGIASTERDITGRKREAEEAARMMTVMRDSNDAILIQDFEGRITAWNHGAELMFGYSEQEALRMKIWQLTPQNKEAEQKDFNRRLFAGEKITSFETQRLTKDGRLLDVWLTVTKLVDDAGKVIGVASTERDITERMRMESELTQSAKRLSRFYNSGLLGVIYWNMRGKILDANDKFLQMVGYTRDELAAGKVEWVNMTPPEYRHLDEASIKELKATGVNQEPFEKEYIRKDGTRIPIVLAGAMLDEERVNGVAFILDVSERKHAEEKARKSDVKLMALIESTSDWVWETDDQGLYTYSSPAVEAILGYKPEEILGKTSFDLMPEKERSRVKEVFEALVAKKLPLLGFENVNLHKDGHLVVLETSGQPFFSPEGLLLGYRGIDRDITERTQSRDRDQLTRELLELMNRPGLETDVIREILLLIKKSIGIEAVGLRLRDGDDFPYYMTFGFPEEFVVAERALCAYGPDGKILCDVQGNSILECMCGNIISGRTNPKLPFFTEGGSFWSNCTTDLLATTTEEDRQARTRNRCNGEGYESVALIPLTSNGLTIGLLQLNDKRRDQFTLNQILFFQGLGAVIGIALDRAQSEKQMEILARFPMENPFPVLRIKPDGTLLYANPSAHPLMQFWGCWPGRSVPAEWIKLIADATKTGEWCETEVTCYGRSYQFNICPIQGAGYVNVYGIDNTEQKKTAEELAILGRKNELILNSAGEGILGLDLEGNHTFVNPAAAKMLGYEAKELLGRSSHGAWHHTKPDGSPYPKGECLIHATCMDGTPHQSLTELFWRKDGTSFPVEYVSRAVYAKDGLAGAVVTFEDITKRKKAEDELLFRNLILSTQQETSVDGILVVDADGKIISSNRRFIEMWGIPRDVMESKSDERALQSVMDKLANPEEFIREVKRLYTAPDEKSRDEVALKDGGTFDRYSAPMIGGDGKHFGRVWYFRDITERKRAEEKREELETQLRMSQKMEAIGSLAGGIAHDFNNLLSVILSYTQFTLDGLQQGDPRLDDLLEVKKAAERAASLTRQLLAYGRKQVLQSVQLNLNETVAGIEKMLRRILGEDVSLLLGFAPDLGLALADPGQIEQVLMNLVVNARDAMPEGGKLTIKTSNVELDEEYAARHVAVKPGPYVLLEVTDSGCGMDKQTQAKIFDPFFTTKEKGKGTGLGLPMVYGIVKQSGGNIWVYSEPGRGATFKIYLPRDLSGATAAISCPVILEPAVGTETILVVEDEVALRKVAKRALDAAGYTVLTAANGDEAILASDRHKGDIHLLLTDVVLPGMSGRTLAQGLSKTRSALKVLYMSGYTDDAIIHHGVLDAGTRFLGKPFTTSDLTRKVREVLNEGLDNPAAADRQAIRPDTGRVTKPLDRDALRVLPKDLVDKFRQAVIAARYDEIIGIIGTIRLTQPDTANGLGRMAELYDYAGLRDFLHE